MTEETFWNIIARFDWNRTGDDDAVIEPAVNDLSAMADDAIREFEDILAAKLNALDTVAHARAIGNRAYRGPRAPFSPDWFLYVRCCVVANGQEFYADVLADPERMPQDMEFEAILYVAERAYERKTGKTFDHVSNISYETFSNRSGWIE
jgi:Protein of unknown function (DUF4240)